MSALAAGFLLDGCNEVVAAVVDGKVRAEVQTGLALVL